jgi:hypothetical protein
LDSNPNDSYAKSQLERCNNALNSPPPPTSTPNVSQSGAGRKKQETATTLTTSTQSISLIANGGKYIIDVKTNASDYQVYYLPTWCTVGAKYNTWFSINCNANNTTQSRSDWFEVVAGDKRVRITVKQAGIAQSQTKTSHTNNSTATNKDATKSCFNCPKTNDTWGLTLGYAQQTFGNYSMDGIQFGLRAEPLFKYGFGLNTGIVFGSYSSNNFNCFAVHIPLHLEYRLNFSKWFNIFAYGGTGFTAIANSPFDDYALPVCFEYGGGFRISHVQLNLGTSLYLGDFRYAQDFENNRKSYQNLVVSLSYMF